MIEKRGILRGDGAVDLQALIGPAADPIAVVKVGMTGIAVADEGLVMAAARAQSGRAQQFMAIVLGVDVSAGKEIVLFFPVDAGGHMTKDMLVSESTKRWQGAMSPDGPTPTMPRPGAAGMRFVYTLVQLGERVADVGKAVVLAAQRELQIFICELAKLLENAIHSRLIDGVKPVRRSGDRRKADLMKTQLVLQVLDRSRITSMAPEVMVTRAAMGRVLMIREQALHLRLDDVVTAAAVREDAKLVLHLLGPIHADGNADAHSPPDTR